MKKNNTAFSLMAFITLVLSVVGVSMLASAPEWGSPMVAGMTKLRHV